MKKRIISLLLTVASVLAFMAVGTVTASAESAFNTSEDCINMIKEEEGFAAYPYWDYAQYTIGYGTKCPDDLFDYYSANGITREEADALLRQFLDRFEEDVNVDLIDKFGLMLTQNQFDALIMFSYNCGTGWIYNDSDNLRRAVINGAVGNEIIDRFTRWCNAGGQIKIFLIERRLAEANLYLNGIYSRKVPENFGYVLYDANGGSTYPNVQGYSIDLTAAIIPIPTYEGYQFAGWYTAREGGTQVTVLDASVRNSRLYAHWKDAAGNDLTADPNSIRVTVKYDGVNLRQEPTTASKVIGMAYAGDVFYISETAQADGYTWGKYTGGWICLDLTDYEPKAPEETVPPETQPEEETKSVMGTVKVSDTLRIRSGPSTGYSVAGYLRNGDRVEILEQKQVGHMTWGRIDKGWISLDYVVLDTPEEEQPEETVPPETTQPPEITQPPETTTPPETTAPPETMVPPETRPEPETWTGTVNVSDALRVRTGPGTDHSIAGYLQPNARVTITEKQTVGTTVWGKTEKGWISLDYVKLDVKEDEQPIQRVMGTVKVNAFLRIRSGPGTTYAVAGYLAPDDRVEILEQKTVGTTKWGRISRGWISLDYVVLDQTQQPTTVTKTVTADCLRIRSDAGTSNLIVGFLYRGAKVEILETKTVAGVQWGRTAQGWISMDYVK